MRKPDFKHKSDVMWPFRSNFNFWEKKMPLFGWYMCIESFNKIVSREGIKQKNPGALESQTFLWDKEELTFLIKIEGNI